MNKNKEQWYFRGVVFWLLSSVWDNNDVVIARVNLYSHLYTVGHVGCFSLNEHRFTPLSVYWLTYDT